MTGNLRLLLWVVLVIAGIGAMQWGASRASAALEAYRHRAGLAGVVAGALLGIATASYEEPTDGNNEHRRPERKRDDREHER